MALFKQLALISLIITAPFSIATAASSATPSHSEEQYTLWSCSYPTHLENEVKNFLSENDIAVSGYFSKNNVSSTLETVPFTQTEKGISTLAYKFYIYMQKCTKTVRGWEGIELKFSSKDGRIAIRCHAEDPEYNTGNIIVEVATHKQKKFVIKRQNLLAKL